MKKTLLVWKLFPDLVKVMHAETEACGSKGTAHDLIHDLTVAQYCLLIERDQSFAQLATIAALCHSTDRRYPTDSDAERSDRIDDYLLQGTKLNPSERGTVIGTVLEHHKPNEQGDGKLLRILKDADRLANLSLPATLRCAQFYHALPTFDPRYVAQPDPKATYRQPLTVLHDVRSALEWDPREGKEKFCLRLPKAIKLATPYFDWLKAGIALTEQQVLETSIRDFKSSGLPLDLSTPFM